ncbi:type III glutamate--ammonia ligase [Desulfatitalea alkaliphila]|uniref:Type III glutamate--ammonia ligase n=1 Tax=Desulfatitalea alkaliphila TaxID=2929485 RepID=A0AA41R1W2_9BACT|nr:type III glutamate--ammonia ligase [Desulfatitalea alkaliphila]MCJ8499720.1 type III glutamate--ammonia ligase [Desulfatitalea alkaliphila]
MTQVLAMETVSPVDDEKREQVRHTLESQKIEFILAQFVDIHGCPKVKQVPVDCFDDLVDGGAGFAGGAVWGLGQGPHNHDLMARADLDTFVRLPWRPNVAVANCDIFVDNEPWPFCVRTNLRRMVGRFAEAGYTLNGGFEPEHFLVEKTPDGGIRPWDPLGVDTLAKPCYDFRGMCQTMDYLQEIIRCGNQMGLGIYQSDHEDANGQYEINFGWTHALHAGDQLVRFRMMAGQIAPKYGAVATFMAKPFDDKTGSGAHLHFHVADSASGRNLFPLNGDGEDLKGLGLSSTAIHFIGGLLKHIGAITAIASPTINCYRRIQSGEFVYSSASGYTWTPAYASYGDNNRTQLFRCPDPNRFEDRSPSAMVNPYLLLAAHMAAGLDGIRNRIDPGDAIIGENVWNLSHRQRRERGMILLPQNLSEAIAALEADPVVQAGLGPIAQEYIRLKKAEWSEFMRTVTPWEVQRLLTFI